MTQRSSRTRCHARLPCMYRANRSAARVAVYFSRLLLFKRILLCSRGQSLGMLP